MARIILMTDFSEAYARSLLLVEKKSQTPAAYPRNGGKIAKAPLK